MAANYCIVKRVNCGRHAETSDSGATQFNIVRFLYAIESCSFSDYAVNAVLSGKDTFLDVPTGHGKSLVFMVLPSCVRIILEALGDANLQVCKTAPVYPKIAAIIFRNAFT